ncbi:hypothetical protein ACHFJ0_00580 [Paracoccus sp. NGMCC 1.201697]|uniref:Uncharacterized protein n=1 Tax=Paracoccus broussonetiae subsp. drimophilus TaxID=3373869 RepID=A0ABW7LFV5_9RHOB
MTFDIANRGPIARGVAECLGLDPDAFVGILSDLRAGRRLVAPEDPEERAEWMQAVSYAGTLETMLTNAAVFSPVLHEAAIDALAKRVHEESMILRGPEVRPIQ